MNRQEQLAELQNTVERTLREMHEDVHNYADSLETGPILKGLTAGLESYVRHELVDHVARHGKDEGLDEALQPVLVMVDTITLIGKLIDNSRFCESTLFSILDLKSRQQANE